MHNRDETDIQVVELNLRASNEKLALNCSGCRAELITAADIKGYADRAEVNSPFVIQYLLTEWVTGERSTKTLAVSGKMDPYLLTRRRLERGLHWRVVCRICGIEVGVLDNRV